MPSPFVTNTTYQWSTNCTGDKMCTYALKCYSCYTPTYVLEEGICITRNRCRKYSLYNSTVSGFNAAYCYCKPGFYLSGVTSCSICHYKCKTCTGPASTQCTTCHTGLKLSGTACVLNGTYDIVTEWNGAMPTNNATSTWTTSMTGTAASPVTSSECNCKSTDYVFGYYGYDDSPATYSASKFGHASLTYVSKSTVINTPHYGIHFRAKFLFIDDWTDGMMVVF